MGKGAIKITEPYQEYGSERLIRRCGDSWEVTYYRGEVITLENGEVWIDKDDRYLIRIGKGDAVLWTGEDETFFWSAEVKGQDVFIDGVNITDYEEPQIDIEALKNTPVEIKEPYQSENVEKIIRKLDSSWKCLHYRGDFSDFINEHSRLTTDEDTVYIEDDRYRNIFMTDGYDSFFDRVGDMSVKEFIEKELEI